MGIGIPPKLLRKEIFMTIGDIETAVPYKNANPEEEMRKTLYSKFKETNWWARHPRVWQWASAAYWLMVIVLAVNMKNGLFLPGVVAASALGFMPFLVFSLRSLGTLYTIAREKSSMKSGRSRAKTGPQTWAGFSRSMTSKKPTYASAFSFLE